MPKIHDRLRWRVSFFTFLALVFSSQVEGRARGPISLDALQRRLTGVKPFRVTVVKQANQKDVYLFRYDRAEAPNVNQAILLGNDGGLMLAVRVIKTAPEKKLFIAKLDPRVEIAGILEVSQSYSAYEDTSGGGRNLSSFDAAPGRDKLTFAPAIGFSSVSYSETPYPDFSLMGVNVGVGLVYALPQIQFSSETTMTVFDLSHSDPDLTARLFATNLLAGYSFQPPDRELRFTVFGGWYYRTTFFSSDLIGFKNVSGITAFPSVRYRIDRSQWISAQVGYSPVMSGFSLLGLSSRELFFGVSYLRALPNSKNSFSVKLDYSNLKFAVTSSDNVETDVQSSAITLSTAYVF